MKKNMRNRKWLERNKERKIDRERNLQKKKRNKETLRQ